ncbi:hypothetical protein [Streptomyces griseocarneus]|uniref:hypothetical protein n=1 Tax=Streptomyces griseocarneus TaxID=51201 RepID=UPI00167C9373|nr:hypothetical protein [Streptomyces griseocarneus]MBZ6475167.1 hypothetical protein [Streptomyces griseocarneus]GHG61882.1 hypothetical protein GCM10018779_30140 [Streptomyces griseocarneus]
MCDWEPQPYVDPRLLPNSADVAPAGAPVAAPITVEDELPGAPGTQRGSADDPAVPPFPSPLPCRLDFPDGCYQVTIRPDLASFQSTVGTLRVDRAAPSAGPDGVIVSGDLYRQPPSVVNPAGGGPGAAVGAVLDQDAPVLPGAPGESAAAAASRGTSPFPLPRPIPVFPRDRYRSYLKGTRLVVPRVAPPGQPCQVTVDVDEFDYTQPATGSFQGSFPFSPSRSLTFVLNPVPSTFPTPFPSGPRFEGRVLEGGTDRGSVSLTWTSSFLRRAVLEIDTLRGAVAPQPVPDAAGTGTEFFDTVYATAGWQLTIDRAEDQVDIPAPTGVNPSACWSPGDLHALMAGVRKATTDLDAEWRTHLVVVPATMGCSRGVMYDQIDVPREGSASFSDDGYPGSSSSNFGTAENQLQRNVLRAYLRSATHEVTHAFNQIHQEEETAPDNSIMTTTPSVADVLGGPTTGAPGVFPDQINLGFNTTVRNHLAHMPDPVVRPGGWPFGGWTLVGAPQASDRNLFHPNELKLEVGAETGHAPLGAPVTVSWKLTNTSGAPLLVPNDVRMEALFTTMSCVDESGEDRPVRPFVITCEEAKLAPLEPGASLSADYRVFWSSDGFPLERPGRHTVTVTVAWSAGGLPVAVTGTCDIWVDRPTTDAENRDAALVMHPEVGKWVVLGGGAHHLEEAVDRLRRLDSGDRRSLDLDAGVRSRVAEAFSALELMPTGTDTTGPA